MSGKRILLIGSFFLIFLLPLCFYLNFNSYLFIPNNVTDLFQTDIDNEFDKPSISEIVCELDDNDSRVDYYEELRITSESSIVATGSLYYFGLRRKWKKVGEFKKNDKNAFEITWLYGIVKKNHDFLQYFSLSHARTEEHWSRNIEEINFNNLVEIIRIINKDRLESNLQPGYGITRMYSKRRCFMSF